MQNALSRRAFLGGLAGLCAAGCGGSANVGPLNSDDTTDAARGVYVALGDSYAYGYTNQTATPYTTGDQGYVRLFADYLATQNDSQRPDVFNLANPGETTASFLRGSGPAPPRYNQNYAPDFSQNQAALFAALADERDISVVTLQIGGNDLLGLVADPAFLFGAAAARQTRLDAAFATLETNYRALLRQINALAPNARVLILGYPDPFAGLGAQNPLAGLSTPIAQRENALYERLAGEFGARYVDLFAAFAGRETELTLITTDDPPGSGYPNFHPTFTGYQEIAARLAAQETHRGMAK